MPKKHFGHSAGQLNDTLAHETEAVLRAAGHAVKMTTVDDGYDIDAEIEKYLWADVVIYQMPGWWMGAPWILKKNTSTKSSPLAMASCTPAMAAAAATPAKKIRFGWFDPGQAIYVVGDLERTGRSV